MDLIILFIFVILFILGLIYSTYRERLRQKEIHKFASDMGYEIDDGNRVIYDEYFKLKFKPFTVRTGLSWFWTKKYYGVLIKIENFENFNFELGHNKKFMGKGDFNDILIKELDRPFDFESSQTREMLRDLFNWDYRRRAKAKTKDGQIIIRLTVRRGSQLIIRILSIIEDFIAIKLENS